MMPDLYATLGVPKDADPDTVKKAHRQKVSKLHPDKGGNAEAFLAVQRAYEVLSDEERRKRYDETGRAEEPKVASIESELIGILAACVSRCDIKHNDIVAEARKVIGASLRQAEDGNKTSREQAARFQDAANRLTAKDGKPNLFSQALNGQADKILEAVAKTEARMADGKTMLAMLDALKYKTDEMTPDHALNAFFTAQCRY